MTENFVSAIEVGTSRTVMAAGRAAPGGGVELLAFAEQETTGMRKGRVVEPEYVSRAIQTVRESVEAQIPGGGGTIRDAAFVCSFGGISCDPLSAQVPVTGPDGLVDADDVARARSALLSAATVAPGREALGDAMALYFTLDGRGDEILEPRDMAAETLGVCGMSISVDAREWDALAAAADAAGIQNNFEIFSALAAAHAALSPQKKLDGALCIDMGGGTTSYCAYHRGHPIAAGALPVGGDHVTNDLLSAFKPGSSANAGRLKTECGRADPEAVAPESRVRIPDDGSGAARTVSEKAVAQVVHARLDETLRLVRADLDANGVLPWLGGGIVLTGGAAKTPGMAALAARVFGIPCSLATLDTGYPAIDRDPLRNATIWGGLARAIDFERRQAEVAADGGIRRFFKNLFSREGQMA